LFLKNNIKGKTLTQLTIKFNKHFNLNLTKVAIRRKTYRLGLIFDVVEGRFKKGHTINTKPIGSERICKGYIEVKVKEPNIWQLKHRVIYEKHFGKVPENYVVIFADGNNRNFDIDNLLLVTKNELLIMNKHKLIATNIEVTKTGHNLAKVISKIGEIKNERL